MKIRGIAKFAFSLFTTVAHSNLNLKIHALISICSTENNLQISV